MRRQSLTSRRGAGLWEIAMGIVAATLVLGFIQQMASGMMTQARVKCAYQEMAAILSACRQYEARHGAWPTRAQLLEVMPQAPSENAWGRAYVLGVEGGRMWVETSLPRASVPAEKVRLSTAREYGSSWRLMYEKRNVYAP
ncbi:MAG: hypothetical protein HQL17_03685 [Candidatus Omnitrophica bacterium]|nr:hypothetical protein [Candidatus Omnitrophota bacterium]